MMAQGDVTVSIDMYVDDSVKNLERKSRGVADKLIVKGPSTRKPKDWKAFLQNEDNKNNHVTTIGDSDSLLIFFKEGRPRWKPQNCNLIRRKPTEGLFCIACMQPRRATNMLE